MDQIIVNKTLRSAIEVYLEEQEHKQPIEHMKTDNVDDTHTGTEDPMDTNVDGNANQEVSISQVPHSKKMI